MEKNEYGCMNNIHIYQENNVYMKGYIDDIAQASTQSISYKSEDN